MDSKYIKADTVLPYQSALVLSYEVPFKIHTSGNCTIGDHTSGGTPCTVNFLKSKRFIPGQSPKNSLEYTYLTPLFPKPWVTCAHYGNHLSPLFCLWVNSVQDETFLQLLASIQGSFQGFIPGRYSIQIFRLRLHVGSLIIVVIFYFVLFFL